MAESARRLVSRRQDGPRWWSRAWRKISSWGVSVDASEVAIFPAKATRHGPGCPGRAGAAAGLYPPSPRASPGAHFSAPVRASSTTIESVKRLSPGRWQAFVDVQATDFCRVRTARRSDHQGHGPPDPATTTAPPSAASRWRFYRFPSGWCAVNRLAPSRLCITPWHGRGRRLAALMPMYTTPSPTPAMLRRHLSLPTAVKPIDTFPKRLPVAASGAMTAHRGPAEDTSVETANIHGSMETHAPHPANG